MQLTHKSRSDNRNAHSADAHSAARLLLLPPKQILKLRARDAASQAFREEAETYPLVLQDRIVEVFEGDEEAVELSGHLYRRLFGAVVRQVEAVIEQHRIFRADLIVEQEAGDGRVDVADVPHADKILHPRI